MSSDRRHRSGAAGFNLPVPVSGTRDRIKERGMVWRDAGRVKGVVMDNANLAAASAQSRLNREPKHSIFAH
jgi:hypothetical protein